MAYQPEFEITPAALDHIEHIAALRERILTASVQVPWVPALQKDARGRNTHSSTAIEGNPLTLEQVRRLEEGETLKGATPRAQREVLNYLAALRFVEKHQHQARLTRREVFQLHRILASGVMDQGESGRYRTIAVRVGRYIPPPANQVSGLMAELLQWWNQESSPWSPVVSSAVIHFRFEDIHPFADGNGRTGRALALWELYRRGFDTHHIFSTDEFYWEDRPRYYRELDAVRKRGGKLDGWIEYVAEGLHLTLERTWLRVQELSASAGAKKIVLRPKQEQLLRLLRDHQGLTPKEIRETIGISRQGAMDLLRPLLEAGLVRRLGTRKTGRYVLA